jgi:hypothetical protein
MINDKDTVLRLVLLHAVSNEMSVGERVGVRVTGCSCCFLLSVVLHVLP